MNLKVYQFSQFVKESLEYQRTFNPVLWKNDEFNPDVRAKLLQIANDFYTDLKVTTPIVDVMLTGSMANYTWSENSDIDIHVAVDFAGVDPNEDLVKKAFDGQRFIWNIRHPVMIHQYDVELYIQDVKETHIASGVFSLLHNRWIKKPVWNKPKVDKSYVEKLVAAYDYEIKEIEKKLCDANSEEARYVLARIEVLKKKIMKARRAGLERDGEFSIENLVFKELRYNGSIERLINIGSHAYSEIYSENESLTRIKLFPTFETIKYDDETKKQLADELVDLKKLVDLNLIDTDSVEARRRDIVKNSGDATATLNDPIMRRALIGDIVDAMESPQFAELQRLEFNMESTHRQLMNTTIILGTRHAETARISINANSKAIRRFRFGETYPSPPCRLKEMPGEGSQFYINCFQWVIDNIDPTDNDLGNKRSVNASKQRALTIEQNIQELSKLFVQFNLTEQEIASEIIPKMRTALSHQGGNDQAEAVRQVKLGVKQGFLTLVGEEYTLELMTPKLERIITDRQIKWTTVMPIRSFIKSSSGIIQTSIFSICGGIFSLTKERHGLNFSALKYYIVTDLAKFIKGSKVKRLFIRINGNPLSAELLNPFKNVTVPIDVHITRDQSSFLRALHW